MNKIREEFVDSFSWISVDETTDKAVTSLFFQITA
jgi:hypothetical protein